MNVTVLDLCLVNALDIMGLINENIGNQVWFLFLLAIAETSIEK